MQYEIDKWLKENQSRLHEACGDSREANLWEDLLRLALKGYLETLDNIGYDSSERAGVLRYIVERAQIKHQHNRLR
jgi:hypothetical protein